MSGVYITLLYSIIVKSFLFHLRIGKKKKKKKKKCRFDGGDFGSLSFESICRDGKIHFLFIETLPSPFSKRDYGITSHTSWLLPKPDKN